MDPWHRVPAADDLAGIGAQRLHPEPVTQPYRETVQPRSRVWRTPESQASCLRGRASISGSPKAESIDNFAAVACGAEGETVLKQINNANMDSVQLVGVSAIAVFPVYPRRFREFPRAIPDVPEAQHKRTTPRRQVKTHGRHHPQDGPERPAAHGFM